MQAGAETSNSRACFYFVCFLLKSATWVFQYCFNHLLVSQLRMPVSVPHGNPPQGLAAAAEIASGTGDTPGCSVRLSFYVWLGLLPLVRAVPQSTSGVNGHWPRSIALLASEQNRSGISSGRPTLRCSCHGSTIQSLRLRLHMCGDPPEPTFDSCLSTCLSLGHPQQLQR